MLPTINTGLVPNLEMGCVIIKEPMNMPIFAVRSERLGGEWTLSQWRGTGAEHIREEGKVLTSWPEGPSHSDRT